MTPYEQIKVSEEKIYRYFAGKSSYIEVFEYLEEKPYARNLPEPNTFTGNFPWMVVLGVFMVNCVCYLWIFLAFLWLPALLVYVGIWIRQKYKIKKELEIVLQNIKNEIITKS
ncbi:MAG: hypothetical protein MUC49_01315 [Raineya sp.]|jgi:hypothetical protein|nr:hypothetical protein [Raineya sp.]